MKENHKRNRKVFIIIVLILLFLVPLCIFVIKDSKVNEKAKVTINQPQKIDVMLNDTVTQGDLTSAEDVQIRDALYANATKLVHTVSVKQNLNLNNGDSEFSLTFSNSEKNYYTQVLSIVRKDTGEEVYNSGGVKPGYGLGYATLKVDLPKGEYPCTEHLYSVDDEGTVVLQTDYECLITVAK